MYKSVDNAKKGVFWTYSADFVKAQIEELKKSFPLPYAAFKVARLCVGWAYVFGARGELCSPANRKAYYKSKGASHPTIKTKCQYLQSGKTCTGCKWYPIECRTRMFDCRGFTYWIILQVFGFKLSGVGATSQWNAKANWKAKGEIKTMQKNTLVCLFQQRNGKMIHTGLAYNGETVECQNGVQYSKTINSKWTHWAEPVCCDGSYKPPEQKEEKKETPKVKTLKKGSSGADVKTLQTRLNELGYDCGKVDGKYGDKTAAAVKAFQKDHGLKVDGIAGEQTQTALNGAKSVEYYSVTIPHVTGSQAEALIKQYPQATKTKEGG